jgi:hypothetical protein
VQEVHLVGLKEEARLVIVEHLGVTLQGVVAECHEGAIIVEQDSCRRLLVVRIVARVENLDARLLTSLNQPWSNSVT